MSNPIVWTSLIIFFVICLIVDLLLLNKNDETISNKKASKQTLFWVALAVLFSGAIYLIYYKGYVSNPTNLTPTDALMKYFTGYLIELTLSVDNLFVIAMIFKSFKIPSKYQHRVLFWGIIGAIVFRALMIFFGIYLMNKVSWIVYIFGAILIYTALKMLINEDKEGEDAGYGAKLKKYFKYTNEFDGHNFFTIKNGIRTATPLAAALIVIELTDLLFAIDSIPAVLSITTDSFIVFSSNIFAILGLRSMYFFLSNMLEKFHYLKYSVFAILIFVGVKLITSHFLQIDEIFSLIFIAVTLAVGIYISIKKGDVHL